MSEDDKGYSDEKGYSYGIGFIDSETTITEESLSVIRNQELQRFLEKKLGQMLETKQLDLSSPEGLEFISGKIKEWTIEFNLEWGALVESQSRTNEELERLSSAEFTESLNINIQSVLDSYVPRIITQVQTALPNISGNLGDHIDITRDDNGISVWCDDSILTPALQVAYLEIEPEMLDEIDNACIKTLKELKGKK